MAVSIDVSCNDPDNGNFVGKFTMLQVRCGDIDLEFEGPWPQSRGMSFSVNNGKAQIGRIKVPILGYGNWVGNWCWDSISVKWPDALRIIEHLGKRTEWHCAGGVCELCDAFDARRKISPKEWKDAVKG